MKENQENTAAKTPQKSEKHVSWRDWAGGKVFLNPRFSKQYLALLLIFVLSVWNVGNMLEQEQQLREIEELKEDLDNQRMDYYIEVKRLNEEVSQEKVIDKLNKNQIPLEVPDTPPYSY